MPGGEYQLGIAKRNQSLHSLSDSSEAGADDEGPPPLTPLQKLTADMCKDEKTIKDLIVGRRVGFYKVRGEIGWGTFSRVKLGFHALTKGTEDLASSQACCHLCVNKRRAVERLCGETQVGGDGFSAIVLRKAERQMENCRYEGPSPFSSTEVDPDPGRAAPLSTSLHIRQAVV
ncbi:uncharacterized protein nim1kb [Spinachia spinachia]